MAQGQVWLTLPQVVVLHATRNLDLALQITGNNPDLLLAKANRILGMRASVPLDPEATDEQRRDALRQLRRETLAGDHESRYLKAQQQVTRVLASGVSVRGSRKPGEPLKKLDPAEFTRLELRGVDAIDKRTGEVVFYDLRVDALEYLEKLGEATDTGGVGSQAQLEGLGELSSTRTEEWNVKGDQVPALIEWARFKWGDDLNELPNPQGLVRAHRAQFGRRRGISEKTMRHVRATLAPAKARRGGAPTHRR
jgi:hypothetical protein